MANSSGSGASTLSSLIAGSDDDRRAAIDHRKQKRMLSNRESARRSRMRKQKHLDGLAAQMAQLRDENNKILTALSVTAQSYIGVEAENSVLKTQVVELSTRLHSLNEILHCMNSGGGLLFDSPMNGDDDDDDDALMRPWNAMMMMNQNQPIMASADMFHYY